MVREHRPDVVLTDLIMPELDGIDATETLHNRCPEVRVLILSGLEAQDTVVSSVRAGTIGFARKNVPIELLVGSGPAAA